MSIGLTPFAPGIWLCDGPTVTGAVGFTFPTRMAVVRLPHQQGLWVWSPVALTEQVQTELEHLGPVQHLVAPNSLHDTFLADWANAYPTATIHVAPGFAADVLGTRDVREIEDGSDASWADTVDHVVVPGNRITTEVIFLHRPSSTVLVTDWVQHIPKGQYRGWRALVARLDLMTASTPCVPRKFRFATTDRLAARQAIATVLDWHPDNLVIAHGPPVRGNAYRVLQSAFSWLVENRP